MHAMSGARIEKRQEGKSMRKWKRNFAETVALQGTEVATAMSRLRRRIVNDAGGAVVEMAVSSAILFAMFFGVFEIAFASYTSHYVSDMAREGARYAIVRGSSSCGNTPLLSNCGASPTTIAAYVKGLSYPGINPANLTVTVTYLTNTSSTSTGYMVTTWATCNSGICNQPGYMVNVAVSYAFGLAIPFVPKETINVNSASQMVIQQ
jgi:Flp pilus assembly protein TadG